MSPGLSPHRNTLVQLETQHLLSPAPPLRLLSPWQGWKKMLLCTGHSWVEQEPLLLLPAVTSSTGPHCTQDWSEGPLSLPQDSSSLHCFLRGELVVHHTASWHLHTALQPGCHRSPSPSTQDSRTLKCVSKQPVLHVNTDRYQSTAAIQPGFLAEGGDVHHP